MARREKAMKVIKGYREGRKSRTMKTDHRPSPGPYLAGGTKKGKKERIVRKKESR